MMQPLQAHRRHYRPVQLLLISACWCWRLSSSGPKVHSDLWPSESHSCVSVTTNHQDLFTTASGNSVIGFPRNALCSLPPSSTWFLPTWTELRMIIPRFKENNIINWISRAVYLRPNWTRVTSNVSTQHFFEKVSNCDMTGMERTSQPVAKFSQLWTSSFFVHGLHVWLPEMADWGSRSSTFSGCSHGWRVSHPAWLTVKVIELKHITGPNMQPAGKHHFTATTCALSAHCKHKNRSMSELLSCFVMFRSLSEHVLSQWLI